MYKISKQFNFSASHQLHGLSEGHPCGRLHGHNYVATFFFKDMFLDEKAFVKDFRSLQPIKDFIDLELDHRHLNEKFESTTSESLARELYIKFKPIFFQLYKVRISETPKSFAEYSE